MMQRSGLNMETVLKIFENKQYVVAHFYDEERAIEYAKGERVA